MAQLGLAAGGALIGSFFGSMGTSIGWALGGAAGALLFPPKGQDVQGPRLSDLTVQSSAYGTGIPVVYGTVRLAGNIIWSAGIEERATRRRVGKGMTGPRETTYEYTCSFGVSWCDGPIQAVRKLWMDDKLVYDSSGATTHLTVPGLVWRWYAGEEDQLPDPMYEAAVGADDAVPYRGQATGWFENLPLKYFGNRIPNITAEIVKSANVIGIPLGAGGVAAYATNDDQRHISIDWYRRLAYTRQHIDGDPYLIETDLDTMENRVIGPTAAAGALRIFYQVGDYIVIAAGSGNSIPIYKYDKNSGELLGTFYGGVAGSLDTTVTNSTNPQNNTILGFSVYTETDVRRFAVWSPFWAPVGTYCLDLDEMVYIWGVSTNPLMNLPASGRFVEGEQRLGETDIYYAAGSGSELHVYKITVQASAYGITTGPEIGFTGGVVPEVVRLFTGAEVDIPAVGGRDMRAVSVAWDDTDQTLIVAINNDVTYRVLKMTTDGTILWNVAAPAQESRGVTGHRLVNGTYGVTAVNNGYLIDTKSGETISTSAFSYVPDQAQIYDSQRQAVWTWGASNFTRILLGRNDSAAPTLADVVTLICERAGMDASDIDVTDLTASVRGYVLARPMAARAALEPLAAGYQFDAVESDDVLEFVTRGGSIAATVTHADLVRQGEGGVIVEQRAQDVELPRSLTVLHIDLDRGYEQGAQRWQRPLAPTPTMSSREDRNIQIPVVLTAEEAKTIARRLNIAAWRERVRYSWTGTTQHLRLEPTDPVTLSLADGSTVRVRLLSVELGADWTVRFEGVAEDAADYALTVEADGGAGRPDDVLPTPYSVRGFAPAAPLLSDGDDMGGAQLRSYAAIGTYGSDTWSGADLYRLVSSIYQYAERAPAIAAWGNVSGTVAEPVDGYGVWDDATEIIVRVQSGADLFESCTDLEALNGANQGLLIAPDGTVEVIHHATATDNGDGTVTLARLLRGMRGTEDAGTLPAGTLYLLADAAVMPIASNVAVYQSAESFRFAGLYDLVEYAPTLTRTAAGRAEKPYSPVEIAGSRDGSNNLTITWTRRTRIGGEWLDYTETVPISETTEAYEVDIRDIGDTTTLRTITGITSPTTTYSAANQTADGLTPGNPVVVRVYQMSSVIGRGIPGVETV